MSVSVAARTEYEEIERVCRVCGESWPATVEFFRTARNVLGEPYLRRICKACRAERMRLLLGPCRCQGCGEAVYLFRRGRGTGHPILRWRNADRMVHRCEPLHPNARSTTITPDGSGVEPNSILAGTRLSATTRGPGVVAHEVVAHA